MFAAPAVIIKQMLVCVIQPPSLHGILNHFKFGEEIIFLYVQQTADIFLESLTPLRSLRAIFKNVEQNN